MKTAKQLFLLVAIGFTATAQTDSIPSRIPFDGMNLTWINGQSRVSNPILVLRNKNTGEAIITGTGYLDADYNYSFANPIDNTNTISSTIGRHNEFHITWQALVWMWLIKT